MRHRKLDAPLQITGYRLSPRVFLGALSDLRGSTPSVFTMVDPTREFTPMATPAQIEGNRLNA